MLIRLAEVRSAVILWVVNDFVYQKWGEVCQDIQELRDLPLAAAVGFPAARSAADLSAADRIRLPTWRHTDLDDRCAGRPGSQSSHADERAGLRHCGYIPAGRICEWLPVYGVLRRHCGLCHIWHNPQATGNTQASPGPARLYTLPPRTVRIGETCTVMGCGALGATARNVPAGRLHLPRIG